MGAGCSEGGTPFTQTRHIPVGGAYFEGTDATPRGSASFTRAGAPYGDELDGGGTAAGATALPGTTGDEVPSCGTRTAWAPWAYA